MCIRDSYTPPEFETITDPNGKAKRRLVNNPAFSSWYSFNNSCNWISLLPDQIIELKKKLKRERIYNGEIDSNWTKDIIKATKIYEAIYLNNNIHKIICSKKNSVEQLTLFNLKMIKESDMKISRIDKASWKKIEIALNKSCLLYTSPSPRDLSTSRMPSSA